MEVEIRDRRVLIEPWEKMKNSVLMVADAGSQEKVADMVIEETRDLSNQMVMAEETGKWAMVGVEGRPFLVTEKVEEQGRQRHSSSVMEVVEDRSSSEMEVAEDHSSSEMEVVAQVDKEAIQMTAAAAADDPAFDFDFEDFADTEDDFVDVLGLNQQWNAEGSAYRQR